MEYLVRITSKRNQYTMKQKILRALRNFLFLWRQVAALYIYYEFE